MGKVSLFTREWIEIGFTPRSVNFDLVSLFTREWIEIADVALMFALASAVSLFTREWIEIGWYVCPVCRNKSLPLYEGVD